ncbi:hypothetical protein N7462_002020 [Penicillium macrosclerotiorum]|uniref:uncharacterized protein n=1 Tax=Penicillium macrosclerotiorum TaxID=303699 RepID=UPI0025465AB8|nr:uncharacterized protein N7462_002020 [Penicillium macrosclerotiorum]KAJ5692597.1 hypothetical protein N7462_002020 [Penicillium macrosclerotiorum]
MAPSTSPFARNPPTVHGQVQTPGQALSSRTLTLPPEPFVIELFGRWLENPTTVVIRERFGEVEEQAWSITAFLQDVVQAREQMVQALSREDRVRLRDPEGSVFIAVVAEGEYAFAVMALTVYTLGAVLAPLSPRAHPEEVQYFLTTCAASLLCAVPSTAAHVCAIRETLPTPIQTFIFTPTQDYSAPLTFQISDTETPLSTDRGFVLIYTSGTTGPPKGVLHTRGTATTALFAHRDKPFVAGPGDLYLHHMPVHWAGGLFTFFTVLLAGSCIEFCSRAFSPAWLLARLADPALPPATALYLPPPMLDAVAEEVDIWQAKWPGRYEGAIKGIRGLRALSSGAMPVSVRQREAWRGIWGRPLGVGYGMSELFGVESVGRIASGIQVKIDEEGEVCVKSPVLFRRYISLDPDIMNGVFDAEGFFRTGDVGRVDGKILYLVGRASHDIIRFYAWKVYAPEVETALRRIDGIAYAIVVGVPDPHCGQRVAALVVYHDSESRICLEKLRFLLATEHGLAACKLPTLLRVAPSIADIPSTVIGKPMKGKIRDGYFNETALAGSEVEVWNMEKNDAGGVGTRPFDWGGIQR